MALIVEDGTGLANAESYISVAYATSYHADRGNSGWAAIASDTIREQLLRKATEYMLQVYRMCWKGYRTSTTQSLDWPRNNVLRTDIATAYSGTIYYPDNEIPIEVKNACAELALKANSITLAPDLNQLILKQKVGPLETEYSEYSSQSRRYRSVDLMLTPYVTNRSGVNITLIRG